MNFFDEINLIQLPILFDKHTFLKILDDVL